MQLAVGQRVHVGPAVPVGSQPRAPAVVVISGLRLDDVARLSAGLALGVTVQIIDLRHTRPDCHCVDECDRVGERESEPATASEAASPAEAATKTATALSRPRTAPARRAGRQLNALSLSALADLIDEGLGWPTRL